MTDGVSYTTDLRASYLLVSRQAGPIRVSARVDSYRGSPDAGEAITLAGFWTPRPSLRIGAELNSTGDDPRGIVEVRYYFGGR